MSSSGLHRHLYTHIHIKINLKRKPFLSPPSEKPEWKEKAVKTRVGHSVEGWDSLTAENTSVEITDCD